MSENAPLSIFLMHSVPVVIGAAAYLTCRRFLLTSTHLILAFTFYLVLSLVPLMSSPGLIVGGVYFILSVIVSLPGALAQQYLLQKYETIRNSPYRLILTATVISVAVGLAIIDFVQQMAQIYGDSLALFYMAALLLTPSLMPVLLWVLHNPGEDADLPED